MICFKSRNIDSINDLLRNSNENECQNFMNLNILTKSTLKIRLQIALEIIVYT